MDRFNGFAGAGPVASQLPSSHLSPLLEGRKCPDKGGMGVYARPVSYTHLTLPTICSV